MPANTAPIFTLTPTVGFGVIDTANTAKDGTGAVVLIFTAGAFGGYVNKIVGRAKGTNTATVLRIWLNNGSTNGTATNNTMIAELTIASTTLSEVAKLADNEILIDQAIPAGYRLYATIGTTIAAGLHLTTYGGAY